MREEGVVVGWMSRLVNLFWVEVLFAGSGVLAWVFRCGNVLEEMMWDETLCCKRTWKLWDTRWLDFGS